MDKIADAALIKAKAIKAMTPTEPECFLNGESLGLGKDPIPCSVRAASGGNASIVIADGHDTGVPMTVPLNLITTVTEKGVGNVAKDLFRS